MDKKRLNVVCAIIHNDNRVFCAQRLRKGPDYVAEHWEFPGGKVEENEEETAALQREISEELDWEIEIGKHLGCIDYEYPDFIIHLSAYHCTALNLNFKLLSHIDCRWLQPEDLSSLDWTDADAKLIKQLWEL